MKAMLSRTPSKFRPEALAYFQSCSSSNTSPIPDALKELCHAYDPIYHVERLEKKRVLMLSGGQDTVVPARCQSCLYEMMIRQFSNTGLKIFHVEQEAQHHVTEEMRRKTTEFIREWICTSGFTSS
jgi:predicted esterase